MMKKIIIVLILSTILITGCSSNNLNKSKTNTSNKQNSKIESDIKVTEIKTIINDKTYILKLENNKTVEEFIKLLPQKYTMNELNGNEKYVYIDKSLPTNASNPKHIEKGDIMLYGDNCLVVFYESFDTTFEYTKIGHIENITSLGSGSITVRFE